MAWAAQINESVELFGDRLEIQFACHHWPIWGRAAAIEYLQSQRDLYKYIHDQTLRLANKGYNKEEIAERITLPKSLSEKFYNRDYYGTVHHNSRAVYVKYLGFFDGNPANLYPLPPTEQAVRYLDFMGGADAVVDKAKKYYTAGDYRWVAEVLNHVVMADPEHIPGRALLADTYEQLGYQCESAPWRNFYLCGALELREGLPETRNYAASPGMAAGIPIENIFQVMAVRLLPEHAADQDLRLLLHFSDLENDYLLQIKNSVLHYFVAKSGVGSDAQLSLTSAHFKQMIMGQVGAAELIEQQHLTVDGDVNALLQLGSLFDQFPRRYPLVTPRDP